MSLVATFDKSFLQSLNIDEAVLFDMLFRSIITPFFYFETLADLKKVSSRREPREEVAIIASKTPEMHGYAHVSHVALCGAELMGSPIEMRQVPIVPGGRDVEIEGKKGVYYKTSRELEALHRWQDGEFEQVEHILARDWRQTLEDAPTIAAMRSPISFRDLAEVRAFTKNAAANPKSKWGQFNIGTSTAQFDSDEYFAAVRRWISHGLRPLAEYAPYVDFISQVDLFFHAAIASSHISGERASNRIDVGYLYYLPFCDVMISSDKLHQRMVPHFLKSTQRFIWGPELKEDLKRLVGIFKAHPRIEEDGLMRIARTPPKADSGLIANLFDEMLHNWRTEEDLVSEDSKKIMTLHKELRSKIDAMAEAAKTQPGRMPLSIPSNPNEAEIISLERKVHLRRGSWRVLPAGVEKSKSNT